MWTDKYDSPYQPKKEYLQIFKVLTLIYLLFYLGAIISFIIIAYPLDKETRGFLTWMAIFGFLPLATLYARVKEKTFLKIHSIMRQDPKWSFGKALAPLYKEDKIWKYIRVKTISWFLYQWIRRNVVDYSEKPISLFIGKFCGRKFNLDKATSRSPYFLLNEKGKRYYCSFEGYILRTTPIKSIKSTILIRPKSSFAKKIKELQKVEIDTQGLFEIYTDNPQTLGQDLPQEFFAALIDYGKNIDKSITILICPENILFVKPLSTLKYLFAPVLFIPFKKVLIREKQKYENFINLIEIINLLEPKK